MAETATLKRPRKPFPIPDSAAVVLPILGCEFDPPWAPIGFSLQRAKEGVNIGLQHGKFWWSLSYLLNVYPPTFREARKWIAAYAAQHGQTVVEMKRNGPRWVFPDPEPGR